MKAEFKLDSECFGGSLSNNTSENVKNWLVYPNPFRDTLNISGIEDINSITYRLYSSSGVLIVNNTGDIVNGKLSLNLVHLNSGVYIVEILAGGRKEIHKVIKV